MPKRIQRKRTKGWRMGDAVYVGRGSKYGNPWRVDLGMSPKGAVWRYQDALNGLMPFAKLPSKDEIRTELRGKDLACWCPLTDAQGNHVPCHADVLLELANGGTER